MPKKYSRWLHDRGDNYLDARRLKDVLERLPTQAASRVEDLLPHRWRPALIDN